VPLQQPHRRLLVARRDHAAESAAHVEDLVHLLVGYPGALLDQAEDRRDGEGGVDLVGDVGGEAVEVLQAAGGDVGEAAHIDLGAQQLEHRLDVDLGRLEQDVAERAAEAEKRRQEAEAERVAGTRPSLELARWAGTWTDPLYGSVEVVAGDEPRLVYGPGLQGGLEHWHYDTYRVHWDAAWRGTSLVRLELDERGRPSALVLEGARFEGHESAPADR